MRSQEIEVREDPLDRIKFWVELLRIEGLSDETRRLADKCLQNELRQYIEPLSLNIHAKQLE